MPTPLKTVVSGLGRIAWQYHLPLLAADPAFRLAAASDPVAERRLEAETAYPGLTAYESFETMIEREKPDLLVLASPTLFHAPQAIYAMERGADVFCEKPLADDFENARAMADCAARNRRKLMVYQPLRVLPDFLALREILDSGKLGRVFLSHQVCHLYNRRTDWQSRLDCGGGMLNNYGAHYIDQFLAMFGGAPLAVDGGQRLRAVGAGDADDVVTLLLRNRDNVAGRIDINLAAAFKEHSWTVSGSRGTARFVEGENQWRLRYLDPGELPALELQEGLAATNRKYVLETGLPWREETIAVAPPDRTKFYAGMKQYFIDGGAPPVPLEETLELMRVISECRKHPVIDVSR